MLRRLSRDSLVYGAGLVVGRVAQILLVPILTRLIRPGEYAISELVAAYSQSAVLVLVLGLDGALARLFYDVEDREARIRMVSSALVFRMAITCLVAVGLAVFAEPIADRWFGGVAYRKYVWIGIATLPFTLLYLFANDVLRVTFQPWKYIVLNTLGTVLFAGLAIGFVAIGHLGVAGVLYGKLAGDAAAAVIGLVLCRHAIRPVLSAPLLRRMLAYGLPMVPGAFAFGWIVSCDRFVLQRTRSLEEVAVYGVAMKFFAFVSFLMSGFNMAFGPLAYSRARDAGAPEDFARVFLLFVAIAGGSALLLASAAEPVVALLAPPAYAAAVGPSVWLSFAAVAWGVYSIAAIGVGLALRTPLLAGIAMAAATASTLLQWTLAPARGPVGAAIGTFVGYALAAIATYRTAQAVYPLPYPGGRLLALFTMAWAGSLAVQAWSASGAWGVAARVAVVGGYATVAWWIVRGGFRRLRGAGTASPAHRAVDDSPGTGG